MARKYSVSIDLAKRELRNARIQNLASAPSSPVSGQIYYDTTLGKFGVYTGGGWTYMGSSEATGDFSSNTSSSVDGEVVVFSGTGGKTGKRATGTGLAKLTSGVLSTATAGTDYAAADHDHTASDITDFDTEVSNNTDVAANTTARHTHSNKATLDAITAAFTTADETKLDGIEAGADVTDRANVSTALGGTALTSVTVATNDKVLIQDTSDSNNLKQVTAQSIADLHDDAVDTVNGQSGTVVLNSDDISDSGETNKWSTAAEKTKLGHITVTQAVDLDAIETRVNGLDAAVVLSGTWDASSGSFPGGGTAQAGQSYIVTTGGTVNSVAFNTNDRIVAIADNASTSTYASNWLKLDYTDQVLSVNGDTGAVVLDTGDIADTTDKRYVTDAQRTVLQNTSGTNTGDEPTATTSAEGVVELATQGEAQAKTATDRALTPASVADFARKYTALIGDGSLDSIDVTHGLGSQWVTAQVFDATSNELIECDVILTSSTVTTFEFETAPTTNQYRVVITG